MYSGQIPPFPPLAHGRGLSLGSHGHNKVMIYLLNRVVDIKIENTFKHPAWASFLFCPCISTSWKRPQPEYPSEQCLGHHAGGHLWPQSPHSGLRSSKDSGAKGWAGYTHSIRGLGEGWQTGRHVRMTWPISAHWGWARTLLVLGSESIQAAQCQLCLWWPKPPAFYGSRLLTPCGLPGPPASPCSHDRHRWPSQLTASLPVQPCLAFHRPGWETAREGFWGPPATANYFSPWGAGL